MTIVGLRNSTETVKASFAAGLSNTANPNMPTAHRSGSGGLEAYDVIATRYFLHFLDSRDIKN